MGDAHVGLQARLMSQALRKLSGVIKQTNTIVIFTNQLRMKIGVMFGSPETTSGGNALKFYASVRLDMRRIQAIKAGGEVIGNRTRVKVKKNKVAPPFTECEFDIMYNAGISRSGSVLDLGVDYEIISKRGAYFRYDDILLGQGRENAKTYLEENPDMTNTIESSIRAAAGLTPLDMDNLLTDFEAVPEETLQV
jgi:recombination protein RecA